MKIDDSFKKPGAVPFKWEIRPGVPKLRHSKISCDDRQFECDEFHQKKQEQLHQEQSVTGIHSSTFPETPRKLKPPPAGLSFQSPLEPRTHSFRSSSKSYSKRFGMPVAIARPDIVSTGGCFPSPLVKKKNGKRTTDKPGSSPGSESIYSLDLDTPPRWSVSSRRSVSPLSSSFASYQASPRPVSPFSSSFASYRSSPQPVSDTEWATFGLF